MTNNLRPFQRLPLPKPCDYDPGTEYFYNNFVKYLSDDMIKLMCTGIYIDYDAVEDLRSTIDDVLSNVEAKLLRNPIIQKYQEQRAKKAQKEHYENCVKSVRTPEYYLKKYDGSIIHRTWVVNTYLKSIGLEKDTKESWSLKNLKNYNVFKEDKVLASIIDKTISKDSAILNSGMLALAEYKTELWNRPRYEKGKEKAKLDPFNPGSAKQKQELFKMLEIEPYAFSDKTDEGSWGRDYIELLLKERKGQDEHLDEILECIIDHSYGGIIKGTFLKAFDTFSIDNVLYGNIKLCGAKTFRNTSNSPNLLNMPSTKSIYAKPLKTCFIAPKGKLVIQCDFQSLEDVVLANISGDKGKIDILTDKTLDSHCYNAYGYFKERVEAIVGTEGSVKDKVRRFKAGVDEGNKELKNIRQESKPHTFGLAYGKFPDEHKGGAITQEIFDRYHNVLYPGVTDFRENYVYKTALQQGYIHLGLGARIYSDNPSNDIRTLNNACSQFWSILTLIAINELNYRIEEEGLQEDIQICSTIYDSIYAYITPDSKIIQWYNNNVYEIGSRDFMEEQVIKNNLTCGIGRNWAEEIAIPVNASIEKINSILKEIT